MSILILTSGMGLGHYIPAILLRNRLLNNGVSAKVLLYESYLPSVRQLNILRTRNLYQRDFRKALLGQKIHSALAAKDEIPEIEMADVLDPAVCRVVVLAGHWCRHLNAADLSGGLDLVHVDLAASPSWKAEQTHVEALVDAGAREIWLSKKSGHSARPLITNPLCAGALDWSARDERVVVHGGGWALGDIHETARELAAIDISTDAIIGSRPFAKDYPSHVRQYRVPEEWTPWDAPPGRPYPPLVMRAEGRDVVLGVGDVHDLAPLVQRSRAVVAKPGGMAIAESLHYATPLLFLPAYGPHEAVNAKTWIQDGFGMWFEDWKASNSPHAELERLHRNLIGVRGELAAYRCI